MLQIQNVSKSFGKKFALRDINLCLQPGECFGLVGPNGAGKTTLLNLVTQFLVPDSGTILFDGKPITRESKKRIGLVPQEIALYDNLTIIDNLKYFGELFGLKGSRLSKRIHELLQWIELTHQANDKVKTLSGGMQRRVNLIAGLLHSPQLLLLDEPTVGVDPHARIFIYELMTQLKQKGTTILYTTHYLQEIEKLCDRAAILHEGKIIAQETVTDLNQKGNGNFEATFLEFINEN